jgi:hypothetical protein
MLDQHPLFSAMTPASHPEPWPTFEQVLAGLHRDGIYIQSEQLAEFFLVHGLPVDLCYVPAHLRSKALSINQHYQGDMAKPSEQPLDAPSFWFTDLEC